MFEISIMIIGAVTLILLKYFLNIQFKEIKKMAIRGQDKLEKIPEKFPSDEKMCKSILKKLNNENVNIKIDPEYTSCLYTVFNNTITLGKFKQNYMKPQTIAHECIHACQNKKILWSNFILSNLYLLYFVVILILTFFNKLPYTNIHIIVFIFLSIMQYIVRFHLESEAMNKAFYVAKEYLEENKIVTTEEEKELLDEYNKINQIGIPFMNYDLISMNIIKMMLYAFIALV